MMVELFVKFELVDINVIFQILLYCFLMLLIDCVINICVDYSGIGIKNVIYNELVFQGYFLECLVYFGVMMIEVMVQIVGVIGIKLVEGIEKLCVVYFFIIDKCKFCKLVLFGDIIEYYMCLFGCCKVMWWFYGDVKVNGVVVVEVDVGVMLMD